MNVISKKTVFVIDTDHDSRVSIRRQLEDAKIHVISASSADEAFKLIEDGPKLDLIMVGRNLVQMTAEEFFMDLRKRKKLMSVPISQIGQENEEQIAGACCRVTASNMQAIISWLTTGLPQADWKL